MNIYMSILMWLLVSTCAASAGVMLWLVWLSWKVEAAQEDRIRKACE